MPKRTKPLFYDSCYSGSQNLRKCVDDGCFAVMIACDIPEGVEIPVKFFLGNPAMGCACTLPGVGPLTAEANMAALTIPGTYELDVSAIPEGADPCVKVECAEYDKEDAECILAPFTQAEQTVMIEGDVQVDLDPLLAAITDLCDKVEILITPLEKP